jgi:uncharacterized iron-regulated membrane protein
MKRFRKTIFWTHLVTALIAGVVIFIMSVTGALLAFERNIIEFAERGARYVAASEDSQRLSPQEIIEKVKATRPDAKPSAMSITNEENAAWLFNLGREGQLYVNPYTGEINGEGNATVRGAMSELRNWHRYVAMSGDQRPIGKAITGACNLVFLFLAISGIYIWMPRKVEWRRMRPVIWFRRGVRGKARNFNWHNVIGFWSSLFLIIFTLTATVISYQWASNLLYLITGNEVPAASQPPSANSPQAEKLYEYPQNINAGWIAAEEAAPECRSVSLRLPVEKNAAVFTIDEGVYWNIFGRSTLTVDANKGAVTKWEPYGQQNSARQLRSWFRFTHTGETGGIIGQFIGFVACVGGAFLVWTGFSLALRRFRNWRHRRQNNIVSA